MASVLQVATIKDQGGNNNAIEIANTSANVTINNLTSSTGFPTGHVIQTFVDSHTQGGETVTTTADDYLGSDLEVSITPKANGNKLYISCFIPDVYNNGSANHSMHSGFRYSDSNFSSGNGSILGPREFVGDHHPFRGDSGSLLINLQYSLVVTVGTNAPSAGTAVKIRPWLQAINGNVTIAANSSNSSFGVFSLIVMEIQG